MTKRAEILKTVEGIICRDRQDQHGKPEDSFQLIADYWSTYLTQELGIETVLCKVDVAVMMSLLKVARLQMNVHNHDNVLDGIGYLALAGEFIDDIKGSDELLNQR